jgi:hypothetical protein
MPARHRETKSGQLACAHAAISLSFVSSTSTREGRQGEREMSTLGATTGLFGEKFVSISGRKLYSLWLEMIVGELVQLCTKLY